MSNAEPAQSKPTDFSPPSLREYGAVTLGMAVFGYFVIAITQRTAGRPLPELRALFGPILAMVGQVFVVWLLMLIVRNYAILSGLNSGQYFLRFVDEPPPDWVERPARTYNNMMQLPVLFYLACVLMMVAQRADEAQLCLAWVFVGVRGIHAAVYIGWNYLPLRFGSFVASTIVLITMFTRLGLQTSELWLG